MRDTAVMQTMIERKLLPSHGLFKITENLIDSFYEIYGEMYNAKSSKQTVSNLRYAKKLAGLSLIKLLKSREELVIKTVFSKPNIDAGFVYIVSNPAFPNHVKIGMTKDLKYRLAVYQTCDPFRSYKVDYYRFFEDVCSKEREILEEFKINVSSGEWIDKSDVNQLLSKHFT